MKTMNIKVSDGNGLGTVRGLLKQMLSSGFLTGLLVPVKLPGGDGFAQSLVRNPAKLDEADPAAVTMAVQTARILSDLTLEAIPDWDTSPGLIGAVMKPCELRATVELVKFLQIKPENLVTIGIDCLGTCEVRDYADLTGENKDIPQQMSWTGVINGEVEVPDGCTLRTACRICQYPEARSADINIGFIGGDPSREILFAVGEKYEEVVQEKLSLLINSDGMENRRKSIEKLISIRKKERVKVFDDLKKRTGSFEELLQVFSSCIRCHNCMNVCPICYCRECVLKSHIFEHSLSQYLNLAARKGSIKMPADTLIFHLTRLSHMATSCIGCGMCSSACPNQLPVGSLFQMMGGELQDMFDYTPGKSIEDEPPVSVFKEDELQAETSSSD